MQFQKIRFRLERSDFGRILSLGPGFRRLGNLFNRRVLLVAYLANFFRLFPARPTFGSTFDMPLVSLSVEGGGRGCVAVGHAYHVPQG